MKRVAPLVVGRKVSILGLSSANPVCSAVGPCALEQDEMKMVGHFSVNPTASSSSRGTISTVTSMTGLVHKHPAVCVSGVGSCTLWGVRLSTSLGFGQRMEWSLEGHSRPHPLPPLTLPDPEHHSSGSI